MSPCKVLIFANFEKNYSRKLWKLSKIAIFKKFGCRKFEMSFVIRVYKSYYINIKVLLQHELLYMEYKSVIQGFRIQNMLNSGLQKVLHKGIQTVFAIICVLFVFGSLNMTCFTYWRVYWSIRVY